MSTQPRPVDEDVTREPPLAFSIREFCRTHRISVAYYYVLKKRGLSPREMELGSRKLISVEEAARWRAARTVNPTEPA